MSDLCLKSISQSGTIRGVSITATEIVKDLAARHKLQEAEAKALGEAAIAGLLLASYCKPGERMNLNIRANGWVKQALVDAYPDGTLRGYVVKNPERVIPEIDQTGEGPWGQGLLSVLRQKDMGKQEPYIGTVPLVTGHLPKDLTYYWLQSEQVSSACGIAVNLNKKGEVETAGGFLIQALPGASDSEIREIDTQVNTFTGLADEVANARDPVQILSKIFQNTAFMVLEKKPLKFQCSCSWDRVRNALLLVGSDELKSMLNDQGRALVHCDFCAKEYQADRVELEKMIAELK